MNRRTDRRTNTHGNNVHRDRRHHAVSTSLQLVDCVNNNGRMNGNRTWCILGGRWNAGVENAGVENAGQMQGIEIGAF